MKFKKKKKKRMEPFATTVNQDDPLNAETRLKACKPGRKQGGTQTFVLGAAMETHLLDAMLGLPFCHSSFNCRCALYYLA